MKADIKGNKVIIATSIITLAILIGYPILIILIRSFSEQGGFTLENYIHIFLEPKNYKALWNSLYTATVATISSTIIGCSIAWFVSRTDIRLKKIINGLMHLNFFIPPFISAMAWQQILGPVGFVNKLYMEFTGSAEPLFSIYGRNGIIFVFTLTGSVVMYMVIINSFNKMQASLEEAAVITGASSRRVILDVTIPILKPSILSAMILVFVGNISNYGVPSVLGFHVSYYTLTTRIYEVLQSFSLANNMEIAAALSMVLVLLAVISLAIKEKIMADKNYSVITGKAEKNIKLRLGKFNVVSTIILTSYGILISILPILAIFTTSLTKAYGLPFSFTNITFNNYKKVIFDMPMFQSAMKNSLFLAFSAATIAVIIGFIVSYICVMTKFKWKKYLEFIIMIPSAMPGTVLAIAMILAWMNPILGLNFSLYNTIWIILIAYVTNYSAQAFRTISGSLFQINTSLEEAAVISGASFNRIMRDIIIPIIKGSIGTAWFLVFIPCLRELTLSIFLWSVGTETLATMIFTLQESGNYTAACALSIMIIIVIMVMNKASKLIIKEEKSIY